MSRMLLGKLRRHLDKSGTIHLFLLRVIFRGCKRIINIVNTYFWKINLKSVGQNVMIEFGVKFEHPNNIIIGDNVFVGSGSVFTSEFKDSEIIIENNVQVNSECIIDHSGGVLIKENTLISSGVLILSHSHGIDPRSAPKKRPLTIEANCWLGTKCLITENCELINENNIVGSGSIVTKSLLNTHTIYAGSPAKEIRKING